MSKKNENKEIYSVRAVYEALQSTSSYHHVESICSGGVDLNLKNSIVTDNFYIASPCNYNPSTNILLDPVDLSSTENYLDLAMLKLNTFPYGGH